MLTHFKTYNKLFHKFSFPSGFAGKEVFLKCYQKRSLMQPSCIKSINSKLLQSFLQLFLESAVFISVIKNCTCLFDSAWNDSDWVFPVIKKGKIMKKNKTSAKTKECACNCNCDCKCDLSKCCCATCKCSCKCC